MQGTCFSKVRRTSPFLHAFEHGKTYLAMNPILTPRPPVPSPLNRKFSRTYLPVLLYNNPNVECAIERAAAWDEAPAVVITRSNGSEQLYNLRALADETPGRVDKELFRLLGAAAAAAGGEGGGATLAIARDVSYGSGTTSVKARRERRAAALAEKTAEAELNAGRTTGETTGSGTDSSGVSAASTVDLTKPRVARVTAAAAAATLVRTTGGKTAEKIMQRVELK
jgi:hypothetical protein